MAKFISLVKKNPAPPPPPPSAISAKDDVTLDLPNNVTKYTKLEAVIQFRNTMPKSVKRARMMKKMTEMKYVP